MLPNVIWCISMSDVEENRRDTWLKSHCLFTNKSSHVRNSNCIVIKENSQEYFPISCLASQAGFEPATYRLGGGCSIQLSYWDNSKKRAKIHGSNLIARFSYIKSSHVRSINNSKKLMYCQDEN